MSTTRDDASGSRHVDLWSVLLSSDDVGRFMNAWLALACSALPEIRHGIVLRREAHGEPLRPVARWSRPGAAVDTQVVADAARRLIAAAMDTPGGLVEATVSDTWHAAIGFGQEARQGGVLVETDALSAERAKRLLRHLQWSQAWVEAFEVRRRDRDGGTVAERARRLLDMVAQVSARPRLTDAARTLAGVLQIDLEAQRVAVGFVRGRRVDVEALAQSATPEKSMDLFRAICEAMAEAVDQQCCLLFSREPHPDRVNARAVARLAAGGGAASVLVVPMPLDANVVGAVTIERFGPDAFSQAEIDFADALVATATPILIDKQERSRGLASIAARRLARGLGWLVGPRALGWKLASLAVAAAVAASLLLTTEHRISAQTIVQGEVRRILSAPFDGYVDAAYARAGELVSAGEVLAELDDGDLQLDRLRILARREQHRLELDRATGTRDLAEINIVRAQVAQDDAELSLIEDQLARTRILAPFNGIVVLGDLSQTIGQAIGRGDMLFELAPLDDYRIVALVSEGDVHLIAPGATGQLLLAALPEVAFDFDVRTIAPIARAGDGVNGFEAIGRLTDPSGRVRPGMEGIARIKAGERSYAYIWSRGLVRWLRLKLWALWP